MERMCGVGEPENGRSGGERGGPPQADAKRHCSLSPLPPLPLFSHLTRSLLVGLIRLYQHTLGRILPDACRFRPTCSNYAIEAVCKHGPLKGGWLGFRRVLRCHPWNPGGYDPVP
jgi:hypothetical protein